VIGHEYLEFELTLSKAGEVYRTQCDSPAGRTAETFTELSTKAAREAIERAVNDLIAGKRKIETPHGQLVKELGKQLFTSLFHSTVRDA
jgi:hypothetical protein